MEIAALSTALAAHAFNNAGGNIRAEPSSLAAERFNAIMNGVQEPGLSGVNASLQSTLAATPAEATPTLGSQILSGLRGAAGDFSDKWKNISHSLEGLATKPAISDMLRLQTELLQVSVQYELIGKAVARSTQNIDTLVRMS